MTRTVMLLFGIIICACHALAASGSPPIKVHVDSSCNVEVMFGGKTLRPIVKGSPKDTFLLILVEGQEVKLFLKSDGECSTKVSILNHDGAKTIDLEGGAVTSSGSADTDRTLTAADWNGGFNIMINVGKDFYDVKVSVNVEAAVGKAPTPDMKSIARYQCGVMLRDAIALRHLEKLSAEDFNGIIAYYLKNNTEIGTNEALNLVKQNPFLKNAIAEDAVKRLIPLTAKAESGVPNAGLPVTLSSIGGLDVTNIADGVTNFLVARAKQELATAFFEKFTKAMQDSHFQDLQALFPSTYAILQSLGTDVYQFDGYMQTLRESFENDFNSMLINMPSMITIHPEYFGTHPEVEALLRSSCYIGEALKDQEHPGEMLRDYPVSYFNELNPNWKAAIQTLQLVSESLRDSGNSSYWVALHSITEVVNDKTTFEIFLGLIYEREKKSAVEFGGGIKLSEILEETATHFDENYQMISKYFLRLGYQTEAISRLVKHQKANTTDSSQLEGYLQYITAGIDLLESATNVGFLLPRTWDPSFDKRKYDFFRNAKNQMRPYFSIIRSGAQMVRDYKRRSYASVIVEAANIYAIIQPHDARIAALSERDFNDLVDRIQDDIIFLEDCDRLNLRGYSLSDLRRKLEEVIIARRSGDISAILIRYGTFMAAITQARNSDEVEAGVEAFALPAGSYRTKRLSQRNVSLNAYIGAFVGAENIGGFPATTTNRPYKLAYGVTAPIGLAWSWSHSDQSYSFFVSLVDLGAVAAFRVGDDSTAQVPTIQLRDIFSPGIFVSWGIHDSPVSINAGYQFGPNLHSVSSSVNDVIEAHYTRFSLSVNIDIPLLDFYSNGQSRQ